MRVAHPQRGLDAAQVRDLVEAHYDDVFAYCCRRMRTADEAQDATQEVFLRFVRTADRYRDAGKSLAYLLTIARNVCADVGRAQSPPLADLPDDDVLGASCTSGQEGLDRDVGEADRQRALRRALATLPKDMRDALELRFDQGLTFVEMGRVLGISRFAARRRVDAALGAVREKLDVRGEDWR